MCNYLGCALLGGAEFSKFTDGAVEIASSFATVNVGFVEILKIRAVIRVGKDRTFVLYALTEVM